jgi:hypothetical protein
LEVRRREKVATEQGSQEVGIDQGDTVFLLEQLFSVLTKPSLSKPACCEANVMWDDEVIARRQVTAGKGSRARDLSTAQGSKVAE